MRPMSKRPGLNSIYGSSENADAFNLANGVYKTKQDVDSYIDGSLEKSRRTVRDIFLVLFCKKEPLTFFEGR